MSQNVNLTDIDAARNKIDAALKNLYMSRVHLDKQVPDLPGKIRRIESELFGLLGELDSQKTGCRESSWWAKR